jgi:hypothetical protein
VVGTKTCTKHSSIRNGGLSIKTKKIKETGNDTPARFIIIVRGIIQENFGGSNHSVWKINSDTFTEM